MSLFPHMESTPILADGVFIEGSAVLYGDITLGQDSSIWPLVAARGDVNYIRIGARTNVQDGSVLHVSRPGNGHPEGFPLIIGEDVTVGHKAMLHGCVIGDRVLVGMGAIVLDGVVVEDEVIIGAGALVPPGKRLESGFLYVGSPVKAVRPLTDDEKAFLKESAAHYVRLKDRYLAEQG
ncbi:gamma carbonic anhydrase family protein [Marinobacter hydrocarbonoclasticus]|nr:gamma carbonic anhydrase family protein [Marinobacter nauticus]